MVTLECSADRTAGVTTVRARIDNPHATPQRVRLRAAVDGPVWPPRRDGVVDPCWDDGAWTGIVRSGRSRGIGFATPAAPTDPPVELVSADRAETRRSERSAAATLDALDDWAPTNAVLRRER